MMAKFQIDIYFESKALEIRILKFLTSLKHQTHDTKIVFQYKFQATDELKSKLCLIQRLEGDFRYPTTPKIVCSRISTISDTSNPLPPAFKWPQTFKGHF